MHLKRYRMPTVQQALGKIREDLGADALILSTRMVARRGPAGWFGRREVEITAAVDRPSLSKNRPAEEPDRHERPSQPENEIVARLQAAGFDITFAREVATAVPQQGRRGASVATIRRALAQCLGSVAAGEEPLAPVEVFVGPPGAGKTTTIAKIAAQERALRGKRLGLVAADGYRVGAVEQLRLYADIIGSSFAVARTPADIARVIDRASASTARREPSGALWRVPSGALWREPSGSRGEAGLRGEAEASPHTLLIDTAGRSPRDRELRQVLNLVAGRDGVRTHLVIPAATTAASLDRLLEGFGGLRPDRIALTRIDEAEGITPIFSALRERGLPLSYLGTGQRVPEDLQRATPAILSDLLLGEQDVHAGVRP